MQKIFFPIILFCLLVTLFAPFYVNAAFVTCDGPDCTLDKLIETIKNPFAAGSGGAGFSVAYMLAEKKVNLVIAGKVGGNMVSALKEKGIEFKEESNKKVNEMI